MVTNQVFRLKADLVHLVYLVCLVYLVVVFRVKQQNKPDRQDRPAFSLNPFSLST